MNHEGAQSATSGCLDLENPGADDSLTLTCMSPSPSKGLADNGLRPGVSLVTPKTEVVNSDSESEDEDGQSRHESLETSVCGAGVVV